MSNDHTDLAALGAIVGEPVLAAEPCGWGFENHTMVVELAGDRRVVVQRMAGRAVARHKLRLARILPERLAAVNLRMPRVIAADVAADPPYAVREHLPGVTAARLMGSAEGAVLVARAMGALLPRLAAVPTAGAGLHDTWARPEPLARLASKYLARSRSLFEPATARALDATIADLPHLLDGSAACFAHGDFCPVNVLVEGDGRWARGNGRGTMGELATHRPLSVVHRPEREEEGQIEIVALLDLEFARIADPLFDAAWWGWVVRYHHPERWATAWPHLLAAAGIPDDDATRARIGALQRLRCLEIVDYYVRTGRPRQSVELWAARLAETVRWQ